jgi:hypothetical protein
MALQFFKICMNAFISDVVKTAGIVAMFLILGTV